MIEHYERNPRGRDLVIGDIHGCFTLVRRQLDDIGFNPRIDRLFSVGDLVDRGPESHNVLEWLGQPWFHAVRGNHDEMAVRFPSGQMDVHNYVANGGGWNVANTVAEQLAFSAALAALPVAIELDTAEGKIGIVHADCPLATWGEFVQVLNNPNTSNSRRRTLISGAQWSRDRVEQSWGGGISDLRALVVGHTPVQQWTSLGNVIYIDTGGWISGSGRKFTILDSSTLSPARPVKAKS